MINYGCLCKHLLFNAVVIIRYVFGVFWAYVAMLISLLFNLFVIRFVHRKTNFIVNVTIMIRILDSGLYCLVHSVCRLCVSSITQIVIHSPTLPFTHLPTLSLTHQPTYFPAHFLAYTQPVCFSWASRKEAREGELPANGALTLSQTGRWCSARDGCAVSGLPSS